LGTPTALLYGVFSIPRCAIVKKMHCTARTVLGRPLLALLVVVLSACSSGTKSATSTTTSVGLAHTTKATTQTSTGPKGSLEFRELEYAGLSPFVFPAKERVCATKHFSPVKPVVPGTVLFDRRHQYCYFVVGPVLLTGAAVESATVVYDPTESEWAVDLHWSNNDFLTKIAHPQVNKIVAIVLNGVVQSAPVINPGITGRDVEITSAYSRAQAVNAAASIMGIAPSKVRVDATG